ncbi:MAG TPA: polysaccharide deacetylase family protein, partial [Nitrososphaeraceae archaeon]|nr:polysaccharide deacetylase family protein [Nitrososphaeraceae archaeon]
MSIKNSINHPIKNQKQIFCLSVFAISIIVTIFIFTPSNAFAQITTNKSCNCVVFRFDDIQDYFLTTGQTSVMDLFLSNNQSLSLGIVLNQFGGDIKIVEKIRDGYQKGIFELALHGWDHHNFANISQGEQMALLNKANQKLMGIYGNRSITFIPPYNNFSSATIEAMHQLGLKIISGIDNLQVPSERLGLTVTDGAPNSTGIKINNFPQNVNPFD